MDEALCPKHSKTYTSYCTECKKGFCVECKSHKEHNTEHVFHILDKDHISSTIEEVENFVDHAKEIYCSLMSLLSSMTGSFEQRRADLLRSYQLIKIEFDKFVLKILKKLEQEQNKDIEEIKRKINNYKELELKVIEELEKLNKIKDACEANFNKDQTEAYLTIKSFEALNLPHSFGYKDSKFISFEDYIQRKINTKYNTKQINIQKYADTMLSIIKTTNDYYGRVELKNYLEQEDQQQFSLRVTDIMKTIDDIMKTINITSLMQPLIKQNN